jgi:DinB superfamily
VHTPQPSASATRNDRPSADEHRSYFAKYIALADDGELPVILTAQTERLRPVWEGVSEAQAMTRYSPDKWSLKQLLGHVIDVERMFSFRAFAFSRQEPAPLFSFEQDHYVKAVDFDARTWQSLVDEFATVRASTIALFANMTPDLLLRRGIASDATLSVRAAGFIIAGHETHHANQIRDLYLSPR